MSKLIYIAMILVSYIGLIMFLTTIDFKSISEKDSEELFMLSIIAVTLLVISFVPLINVLVGLVLIVYSILKHIQRK